MRFLYCVGCQKMAIEIKNGRVAKGATVRCAKCEEKLQKQLQNLSFLAKMNENKESNPFADLFGKFK
ncbi:hypothetical protein WYMAN_66 [Vibrio phage Wyman]|nr:hypothetical protein WYMAN_66 [Vibrio phage Wyman]